MTNHETDRRERYATAISKWHRDPEQPLYIQGADAVIAIADAEQAELRRERDLAIAHDRQPYPTAWAYEQACKALRRKEAAIERVLEFAASLDETGRQLAGPDAVHPVAAHIRHLLDAQPAERDDAGLAPAAVSVPPPAPRADDQRCAVCQHVDDGSHPAVCFPPAPADRAAVRAAAFDEAVAKHVARAIFALKSPQPPGSEHYRSGWDDGLEAAIDAARDELLRRLAGEAAPDNTETRERVD